jgi:hypothetical protein
MADEVGPPRVVVDQTLHGYGDGHRLLAGSVSVLGQDARTMLVLSDISGPVSKLPPDGYLTGYPLASSGKFVLARTWSAPEMSRPGCVWTHSLLINFSDLASLSTATGLLELFRRPASPQLTPAYGRTLSLSVQSIKSCNLIPQQKTAAVVNALYTAPYRKIIAPYEDGPVDEAMVLGIWMQQWPRLRRSFRFCAFSAADRSSKADPFDLQILTSFDRIHRSRFPDAFEVNETIVAPELEAVLGDLLRPGSSNFRLFLRRIGGDMPGGRSAMLPLCRLFKLVGEDSESDGLKEAIDILEELGPLEARAARTMVLDKALRSIDGVDDRIFNFVVETVISEKGLEDGVSMQRIGHMLWSRTPAQFIVALEDSGPMGQIAGQAIHTLEKDEILRGIRRVPHLAPAIVGQRPELAADADFWRIPGLDEKAILRASPEDRDSAVRVVGAMIAAGCARTALLVLHRYNAAIILDAIDRVADDVSPGELTLWVSAVSDCVPEIASALAGGQIRHRSVLLALARELDPDAVPNDYGEDPWSTAVAVAASLLSQPAEDTLAAFLLSRGLGRRSRSSARLLALSFDRVHEALRVDRLLPASRNLIERHLGWGGFWSDWDRCGRLRDAVASKFVDVELDHEAFGRVTSEDRLFAGLADSAARSGRGRRYLAQVRVRLKNSQEKRMQVRAQYIGNLIS